NERDLRRPLRIGYVSPDLHDHVVAAFFGPILEAHDRAGFEITCYADVVAPDQTTERLARRAERWRSIVGVSDEAVAEQIRKDGIDILVDLAGHTARNRLTLFALRPAPVAVTYLIGHGTTSGLSAIDAFLA